MTTETTQQKNWTSVIDGFPEEGKRIEMVVEFGSVKLFGGKTLQNHQVTFVGFYHNVFGWYKKAGRDEAHIGEKIRDGKIIKWRYL